MPELDIEKFDPNVAELKAMAEGQLPLPLFDEIQKPKATRTRVTKHDEKGRILEFVQEEV